MERRKEGYHILDLNSLIVIQLIRHPAGINILLKHLAEFFDQLVLDDLRVSEDLVLR